MSQEGQEERDISSHLSRRNSLPRVEDDNQYIHNPVSPITPFDEAETRDVVVEPHATLIDRTSHVRRPSLGNYSDLQDQHLGVDNTANHTAMVAEVGNRDLVRRPSLTASQLGLSSSLFNDEAPCDKNVSDILLSAVMQRVENKKD